LYFCGRCVHTAEDTAGGSDGEKNSDLAHSDEILLHLTTSI
jgi:hypothetical protein